MVIYNETSDCQIDWSFIYEHKISQKFFLFV